jgi:YidC/Oxa1 family membrane protein insertase
MDRNSLVGFGLIFLILIGYYWFTRPSEAELASQQRRRDSIERVESAKAKAAAAQADTLKKAAAGTPVAAAPDTAALRRELGGFASALEGKEQSFVIENDKLAVTLTNKGGRISSVRLKEFRRSDSSALMLFDQNHSSFYYEFFTNNGSLRTDKCYWEIVTQSKEAISFRLSDGQGSSVLQHYRLAKGDYLVDYSLELDSMHVVVLKNRPDLKLVWESTLPKQERDIQRERETSTIYYRLPEESPEYISEMSYEEKELKARLQWVSFKQQFFNSTLIAKDHFDKDARLSTQEIKGNNDQLVKTMRAELYLPYDLAANKKFAMNFFFGPNHFQTLNKVNVGTADDLELHRIIPLGWGIFRWVNRYIVIPVFNFLDDYIGNYGIIILLLTFIIRILLLPLVFKSYKSTAKMRLLKPELDAIKEKYNGDLQKSQIESMALYRKAGVSPMSGCFPLLLQMPVLIALFQFFPSSFELRQKAFLWAHDLSQFDSIYNFPGGFHLPGYGSHISLFTLLMTLSTLATTYINNQLTGVTGQMKWLGYVMPVIFMGVLNSYAAGLNYYYFVSNMVGMGQQWLFKSMVDEKKLHSQMEANRKKPAASKSGFQKRMEDMMKQQRELQARKQSGKKK